MTGTRRDIESFYMNVSSELELEFEVCRKDVVVIIWGGVSFLIVQEQLGAKITSYSAFGREGSLNLNFSTLQELKQHLLSGGFKVILARLIYVSEDEFSLEFEVSTNLGISIDESELDDTEINWVEPRSIKLTYPAISAQDSFKAVDVFNDSRLNHENSTEYLGNHKSDGSICGVFLWNGHCDYDSVTDILIPFYQQNVPNRQIEDIVLSAKIGKRCDNGSPITQLNSAVIRKSWNYNFREFGVKRKNSYMVKFGKCPVDTFTFAFL